MIALNFYIAGKENIVNSIKIIVMQIQVRTLFERIEIAHFISMTINIPNALRF